MQNDNQIAALQQQLRDLRSEHRMLDESIAGMAQRASVDEIQLRRMKKRKLLLKDAIARLESKLIPDLEA